MPFYADHLNLQSRKRHFELKRNDGAYRPAEPREGGRRGDFALQGRERIVTMAANDEETSMICPYCQATLADNARFCTGCGSSLVRHETSDKTLSEAATQVIPAAQTAAAGAAADPLIGCTLEDKYKITARLGEGGMGAVYRATRLRIGDEVAVKVMHAQFVKDAATLERFRREARAAA